MPAYKIMFVIPPYLGDKVEAIRPTKLRSFLAFPYGVLCLASYINRVTAGAHDIKIIDLNRFNVEQARTHFKDALDEFKPDIVGISVMFDVSYKHVAGLAAAAKAANPDAIVILGGAAVTTAWDEILHDQPRSMRFAIRKERSRSPAFSMRTTRARSCSQIRGSRANRLRHRRRPKTKHIENLDDVIPIDYSLINADDYGMIEAFSPFRKAKDEEVKQFFIVTSRGCPFKCVFCAEPTLHGGSMRYASLEVIEDHVKYLVDTYGMNVLTIYDDQLAAESQAGKGLFPNSGQVQSCGSKRRTD